MKLRNKKTGEIWDMPQVEEITMNKGKKHYSYVSLAELNENWEDYKPKEPLIKDEKIRKAVRAWAEANNCIEIGLRYDNRRIGFWSAKADSVIEFATDVDILSKHGYFYTIDELCGEEE